MPVLILLAVCLPMLYMTFAPIEWLWFLTKDQKATIIPIIAGCLVVTIVVVALLSSSYFSFLNYKR